MKNNYIKIITSSLIISIVSIFVIDYFSHLLFSKPMETLSYFLSKSALYFLVSFILLSVFDLKHNELTKVTVTGITVSLIWGAYYNILPAIFGYYPFGISLVGLSFLGMGIFGTGFAFGVVHILAFIGGYYISKIIIKK